MRFRDFRLAGKLSIGFGAVLAVVAISSATTFMAVRNVAEIERLNMVSNTISDEVDQAWGSMAKVQASVRKYVLTGDAGDKSKMEAAIGDFHGHLSEAHAALVQDMPDFVADLEAYRTKADAYLNEAILVEARLAADPATRPQAVAMVMSASSAPLSSAMDAAEKVIEAKIDAWSDTFTAKGAAAMAAIIWTVTASGLASLLVGALMAWWITRAVGRPLLAMTGAMRRLAEGDSAVVVPALGQGDEVGQMAAALQVFKEAAAAKLRFEAEAAAARREAEALRLEAEAAQAEIARQQVEVVAAVSSGLDRLANGDLTFRLDQALAPDYEKLRQDFNVAVDRLQDALRLVSANAAAIRAGTTEISTASDDLSRRTEQQAASLEETAAALDEITATVKKTAAGASHARGVVSTAKSDAERSGEVVGRAVAAMNGIETSSKQIGQIIGVIDEIAFQTNLLALNAGVEAARAGEAGRGFAVVASEVRALAQRSAEAAKEIKALISASTGQVGDGVALVGEAGQALGRIMTQVADINRIVVDIAASAQEQSTGLDQVNTAINQMDQVTQQNAAMVEQSTAASRNLAGEAEELARLVGRFQVGAPAAAAPKAARRAPAVGRPVTLGATARKLEPVEAGWEAF